ncbi:MAG TPA: ABC transporter permease [Phycisphaerales bacterium]|nr:ABC transporter permease [Phycisphaerales bacterium]
MGQPTDKQPAPHRTRASRPIWKRIFAAQEAGLVVVIALMMAALAFFGGSKQSNFSISIPAGGRAEVQNDTTLVYSMGAQSSQKQALSDTAWKLRERDGGSRIAFGTHRVNKFFDVENLLNVLTSASYYAIMGVGMTAIIILAGIDLSIGSIYAIAAILGAAALSAVEAHAKAGGGTTSGLLAVPLLLLVCCATGAACGFINGFSSVALRVHPFIITLGTMAIFRGAVFVFTGGETISGLPDSIQSGSFKWELHLGNASVFPMPTIITILVALAGVFVLSRTVFGRRIFAIGGNEVAAKYAGIPVGRVKTLVYTISGALAGLAASIYVGYYGAAENAAGTGYELNVIAAAVIGGASLSGGRGSALGAVLGAILVQLINNGMLILDIPQAYNQIIMGLAIIIAVVVDQAKSRLTR